jgi:hypothetical protein
LKIFTLTRFNPPADKPVGFIFQFVSVPFHVFTSFLPTAVAGRFQKDGRGAAARRQKNDRRPAWRAAFDCEGAHF